MTFANSPGGKLSRQTKSPRKRKLNTLFGRFLDNGDKGFLQGQLLLLEWTGLLLSPVTLSMRLVGYAFHRLGQSLWYATQQCAENYVAPSKDSAADDVYHNSGSLLPTSVGHMCKLILDSDVEGSQVANVLAALDYTRYSFIMTTIDIWAEYLATPLWIWEVVYRAPVMYFDYYILQKGDQLPPRRHNCLLRYGIDGARKEMQMLQEQIAAQKELVQQSALRRYMKAVPSDNLFDNEPGRRKRSSKRRVNKDDVLVPLDFGPEGSWESVVNICLEREEGAHTYSFCFFGEIKQDGVVSLGRFAHWGKTPPFSTPAPSGLSPPAGMISLEMDTTGASYSVLSDDPHSPPPPPSPDSAARVSASKVSESSDTDNTDFQTDLQVPTNPFSWLLEALQPVQDAVFAQTASFWHYLVQENKIAGASPALNKLIASISAFFESPTFTTSATPGTGAVAGGKGGKFGRGGSSTDASRSAAAFATPAHGSTALFSDDPARQQEYYSTQSYLGGTGCYPRQGIPRRTDVLFECGMSTAITEIVETEVSLLVFFFVKEN